MNTKLTASIIACAGFSLAQAQTVSLTDDPASPTVAAILNANATPNAGTYNDINLNASMDNFWVDASIGFSDADPALITSTFFSKIPNLNVIALDPGTPAGGSATIGFFGSENADTNQLGFASVGFDTGTGSITGFLGIDYPGVDSMAEAGNDLGEVLEDDGNPGDADGDGVYFNDADLPGTHQMLFQYSNVASVGPNGLPNNLPAGAPPASDIVVSVDATDTEYLTLWHRDLTTEDEDSSGVVFNYFSDPGMFTIYEGVGGDFDGLFIIGINDDATDLDFDDGLFVLEIIGGELVPEPSIIGAGVAFGLFGMAALRRRFAKKA